MNKQAHNKAPIRTVGRSILRARAGGRGGSEISLLRKASRNREPGGVRECLLLAERDKVASIRVRRYEKILRPREQWVAEKLLHTTKGRVRDGPFLLGSKTRRALDPHTSGDGKKKTRGTSLKVGCCTTNFTRISSERHGTARASS